LTKKRDDLKNVNDLTEIIRLNPSAVLYYNPPEEKWYLFSDEPESMENLSDQLNQIEDKLIARSSEFDDPIDTLIEALAFHAKLPSMDVDENEVVAFLMDEEIFQEMQDDIHFSATEDGYDGYVYGKNDDGKGEEPVNAKNIVVEQFTEKTSIDKVKTAILDVPKYTPPAKTLKTKVVVSTASGEKKTVV